MPLSRSLATVFVLAATLSWGQDSRPTVTVRPLEQPAGGNGNLVKTVADNWAHLWTGAGFSVVDGTEAHPARFEAKGLLVRENGNLVLQVAVTDVPTHSVVASEMLSVYEGLTAFEPINEALAAATRRTNSYWQLVLKTPLPVPPIQDALVFLSPDDGASLYWQGHEPLGQIADGQVTAPYYPFPSNAVLTVTIAKPGWRTKTLDVTLDPSLTSYQLPPLEKLRIEELHTFVQGGRLLGMGLEYRKYFLPEWAFWSAELYPFVQYRPDVEGSRSVLHLDAAGSAGTWLYFSADSWFRFGVQASAGLSQTILSSASAPDWFLDATITPFGVLLEVDLWGLLLDSRIQAPYSLGLRGGLLPQSWLLIDSTVPMLSLGVVTKW